MTQKAQAKMKKKSYHPIKKQTTYTDNSTKINKWPTGKGKDVQHNYSLEKKESKPC